MPPKTTPKNVSFAEQVEVNTGNPQNYTVTEENVSDKTSTMQRYTTKKSGNAQQQRDNLAEIATAFGIDIHDATTLDNTRRNSAEYTKENRGAYVNPPTQATQAPLPAFNPDAHIANFAAARAARLAKQKEMGGR